MRTVEDQLPPNMYIESPTLTIYKVDEEIWLGLEPDMAHWDCVPEAIMEDIDLEDIDRINHTLDKYALKAERMSFMAYHMLSYSEDDTLNNLCTSMDTQAYHHPLVGVTSRLWPNKQDRDSSFLVSWRLLDGIEGIKPVVRGATSSPTFRKLWENACIMASPTEGMMN